MIKKHFRYIIFIIILILFYLIFLIINYKYKEYKINSHIEYIEKLNNEIRQEIQRAKKIIEYKSSKAYKNKILKQDFWYKNKGEKVVSLILEDEFNKYTKTTTKEIINEKTTKNEEKDDIIYSMTIFQKWMYFLFKKEN